MSWIDIIRISCVCLLILLFLSLFVIVAYLNRINQNKVKKYLPILQTIRIVSFFVSIIIFLYFIPAFEIERINKLQHHKRKFYFWQWFNPKFFVTFLLIFGLLSVTSAHLRKINSIDKRRNRKINIIGIVFALLLLLFYNWLTKFKHSRVIRGLDRNPKNVTGLNNGKNKLHRSWSYIRNRVVPKAQSINQLRARAFNY